MVPVLTFGTEEYTGYEGFTVPTAQSEGYDIVWRSLNYIITRSEVDDAIIDQMYETISEYCQSEEFLSACETASIEPYICDGDECYELVSSAKTMCDEMYAKYYQ